MISKQETFDMFAATALNVLLDKMIGQPVNIICENACMIADAMMLERKDWGSDGNGPVRSKGSYSAEE